MRISITAKELFGQTAEIKETIKSKTWNANYFVVQTDCGKTVTLEENECFWPNHELGYNQIGFSTQKIN